MKRWSVIIAAVVVAIACVTGCGAATDTGAVKTEGASLNLQPRENLKDGGSLTTVLPEVSAASVWAASSCDAPWACASGLT